MARARRADAGELTRLEPAGRLRNRLSWRRSETSGGRRGCNGRWRARGSRRRTATGRFIRGAREAENQSADRATPPPARAGFKATKTAGKFERIKRFEGRRPAPEGATLAAREGGSEKDTKAEKKAHGATNLRKSHVRVEGDTIPYEFVDKEGVDIKNSVTDAPLAAYVARAAKTGKGDRLFDTDEMKSRADFRPLRGGDYKSKDLRILKSNAVIRDAMARTSAPETDADLRKAVNQVADVVASQPGNTRVMPLESYINPAVFDAWRMHMHDKTTADAKPTVRTNSMEEWKRDCAAFREFANSVSYAGDRQPKEAPADDDDGND